MRHQCAQAFRYRRIQATRQPRAEQRVDQLCRRRGIGQERRIGEDYLERLAASYSQFFYRYEAAPVLIVNTDNLNFADEPADFELLVRCINDMRGPREFISRGGA
jgi:deoxyadenosine/deoxycytidine kinase